MKKSKYLQRILVLIIMLLIPFGLVDAAEMFNFGDNPRLMESFGRIFDEFRDVFGSLADFARILGAVAAFIFIATFIFKGFMKGEVIEWPVLIRPFGILFLILLYPTLLGVMEGILKPVAETTLTISNSQYEALSNLNSGFAATNQINVLQAPPPDDEESFWSWIGSPITSVGNFINEKNAQFQFWVQNALRFIIKAILHFLLLIIVYGLLCLRIFYLVVYSIIGPLVLAISIFPGFNHVLSRWFINYITVWFWLPLIHIMSSIVYKIQVIGIDVDVETANAYLNGNPAPGQGIDSITSIIILGMAVIGFALIPKLSEKIFGQDSGFGVGAATALIASASIRGAYAGSGAKDAVNRYRGAAVTRGTGIKPNGMPWDGTERGTVLGSSEFESKGAKFIERAAEAKAAKDNRFRRNPTRKR